MPRLRRRAQVGQTEPFERHGFQAPGERFGGLLEQVGRGAAENQEPRRQRLAVGQHAQQREQVRAALDFVDHHQPLERAQGGVRLGEPGEALRVFQVEVVERFGRHELPGQRGLAALARPEQRHDAAALQRGADQFQVGFAVESWPE